MKILNIVGLTLAVTFLGSWGICMGLSALLGQSAQYVSLPLCMLLALSSRKLVEKILGYTTLEAMRGSNDQSK